MATIEQFNAGIDEMRRDYPIAIIAMYGDGQRTIFPLRRGKGIDAFQATVKSGHYEHVALKFGGRIMAIWHAQPATGTAQAAFGVGDKVVIRKDADMSFSSASEELQIIQWQRIIGTVKEMSYDGENRLAIEFEDEQGRVYMLLPVDLELWKPAEPDEYTRDAEQARLIARIRELEEALEPFAALARAALSTLPDHAMPDSVWYQLNDVEITIAHFNAVIEALAEAQEETQGQG